MTGSLPTLLQAEDRADVRARLAGLSRREIGSLPEERRAAVLVSFCTVDGEDAALFTQRTETVGTHKGQVSFPGGMVDPGDVGPAETALRELEEELALSPEDVEVLGVFHDVRAITGVPVTPVVGFLGELGDLSGLEPAPDEISQVFTLTMDRLVDPAHHHIVTYDHRGSYPVFEAGPEPVWGLTAWILAEVLRECFDLDLFPEMAG